MKIQDGVTIRVTTNAKNKTTTILAYRKGFSKRPYKAVLPMCDDLKCRLATPHSTGRFMNVRRVTGYHPRNVDALIVKVAKSFQVV